MTNDRKDALSQAAESLTDWTVKWATKYDNTACCGAQQAQACTPKPIDWSKPLECCHEHGRRSQPQIRVLAHGVRSARCPGKTTLVSIALSRSDVLVYVNPTTGEGCSVRYGYRYQICNVAPKPVVKTETSYVNVYANPETKSSVWEGFDTRKEADDANIFSSRDCCVKLTVTSTDGVWSVNSSIESQ